jgi:Bifunctional DNA primase/polymerase, N-terminal
MAKTIYDPNPHISILDDGQVKRQIAEQARRALEMADRVKELPPQTAEQIEAEQFAYESNAYASENPLYASARAASSYLVLPLEPNGTSPLVEPSKATRDPRVLFDFWSRWPSANPGILLGRRGGIFAIRVEDNKAAERLRAMAIVPRPAVGRHPSWLEDRGIGGATVRLYAPSQPFSMRVRGGWEAEFEQAARELANESRNRNPQTLFLVYSYPPVTGLDAFEYRTKMIDTGVKLLGDHAVMPWNGAIVDGNRVDASFGGMPPEPPMWLAQRIGKPRSRKVMAAAREGYEAALRASEAHVMGFAEAQRASTEAARRLALADVERASKALARAEREAEREEQAN